MSRVPQPNVEFQNKKIIDLNIIINNVNADILHCAHTKTYNLSDEAIPQRVSV